MRGCKVPIGLERALRDVGVSPHEVLSLAKLSPHLFDTSGQRISTAEYFALWSGIRAASGRPDIGIELAREVRPDLTEPLFLAILGARDVGRAIEILSSYKRILSPEDIELARHETTGEISLSYVWPGAEPPDVLLDAELCFVIEMCRRGTGASDLAPRALHLRRTKLESAAEHAAYFRCPIHLGAPANTVVLALEDCARPFTTHNPQLTGILVPHLQAHAPPSPRSAIARVRAAIAAGLNGKRPSLGSVGRQLAMSSRALQRLLQENGTSFRALLDDVRNESARSYLGATAYTDGEVAFLLGFEDPTSFYRAFRAWNGMSPSEYRRRPRG